MRLSPRSPARATAFLLALLWPGVALADPSASAVMRERLVLWHFAPLLAAMALTAALIRRFAPERRHRLKPTASMLVAFLAAVGLHWLFDLFHWENRATEVVWLGALLENFITINLCLLLLFDVVLKRLKLRPPVIVIDVVVGVSYLMAFLRGLHAAGVNPSGLAVTGALVTGTVGLSLAPTLGNILGGMALQLDDSIHEGDWIQLDANTQGKVKAIHWRHTEVETRNWDTIIVPNSVLLAASITILGKRVGQPHQRRYWVYFNVDFRHPPQEVIDVVQTALRAAPIANVAAEPPPNVVCLDFARDGRDSMAYYAVRYWLTDLAVDDPTNSLVRERIYAALKRASIPLAMPAQTVFVSADDPPHAERKQSREHARRSELLANLGLFRGFTAEELAHLAERLSFAPYARGESITVQGKKAHWLYILASGEVRVVLTVADGTTREVGALHGPNYFGEMGCMTGEPRSATIVAQTHCECYRLDRDAFATILGERKELAAIVSGTIAERRAELRRIQQTADAAGEPQTMAAERAKILAQIEAFFGL